MQPRATSRRAFVRRSRHWQDCGRPCVFRRPDSAEGEHRHREFPLPTTRHQMVICDDRGRESKGAGRCALQLVCSVGSSSGPAPGPGLVRLAGILETLVAPWPDPDYSARSGLALAGVATTSRQCLRCRRSIRCRCLRSGAAAATFRWLSPPSGSGASAGPGPVPCSRPRSGSWSAVRPS